MAEADNLTDAEVDVLLERFDRTDPKLQRRIVAEFVCRVARLELVNGDLVAALDAARSILHSHILPDNFDGHAARALIMVRDALAKAKAGAA